jgi:YYY domain-containing protein
MRLERQNQQPASSHRLVYTFLLILILAGGAFLRFRGLLWGEYQYLHPDERFLVMVGSSISPVESISEYFNTETSSLNPHNRGHGLYVYGTLPMFLTRYIVAAVYGQSGLDEMTNVGRTLSAIFDVGTIYLVYLLAKRLFDQRVGVLAAAFSSFAVLQIQYAHFFTMDTFVTFFAVLTIYFGVRVAQERVGERILEEDRVESEPLLSSEGQEVSFSTHEPSSAPDQALHITHPDSTRAQDFFRFTSHPLFMLSIGFALALGMAMASKINAAPLALLLPAAMYLRLSKYPPNEQVKRVKEMIPYLGMAAVVSFLTFRILQPYAFSGPGFLGILPNPKWLENLKTLRDLVGGDIGFPPNVQWVNRPIWFSLQNMVLWGLGLPLGILAWAGFLWAGWRMLIRWRNGSIEWHSYILLWGWTGFYFVWQSLNNNPTMRYQLPIYPTLAIFAAWAIVQLWDRTAVEGIDRLKFSLKRFGVISLGVGVILASGLYALGFSNIYTHPITRIEASRWIYQNIPGPINFRIQTNQGDYHQPLWFPNDFTIVPGQPYNGSFTAKASGQLDSVYLDGVFDLNSDSAVQSLTFTLLPVSSEGPSQTGSVEIPPTRTSETNQQGYELHFDHPIEVKEGETFSFELALSGDSGSVILKGTAIANEGAWDDPLPVRIDGYDAFGGIYPGLNFDMYEVDNPQKLERFYNILDQAEYIFISSSRQWGSLPRIPQRYPMNTTYYRHLIGCPQDRSIEWCYNVARPGQFQGDMGFDLIKVFQSNPRVGPLEINDQFAEEAFTVYDHPKVFIFRKTNAYSPEHVREILSFVDLSQVTTDPNQINNPPAKLLMLPPSRLEHQRGGGTWSQIFNSQAIENRFPLLGGIIWYLVIALIGLITYPILRLALSGLPDRGYPLARTAGLLLASYLVWIAGSFQIPFNRLTINATLAILTAAGIYLAYRQREALLKEWQQKKRYFLTVEGLFLLFFILDLLIRIGNPDLWHPWKGGEKPMDFSYFNAILKSTSFPPYDPWFAGGYINYYYYGFVLVGVLVKWLGILPAIAYNLILPTIFAMIALGAFSIGWNLVAYGRGRSQNGTRFTIFSLPAWSGIAAAIGMAVMGNLGTLRMIYQGFQKLAAPGGVIDNAGILTRWSWALQGFILALLGDKLPYALPDWYWLPSRAIPAPGEVEPITEFPFFTVLYGDPHAHLFALPLTLLALAWGISVILGRGWSKSDPEGNRNSNLKIILGFLLGGLAIGSLRPTNTWDFPTYLMLGVIAIAYVLWHYVDLRHSIFRKISNIPETINRMILVAVGVAVLAGLAILFFQPYADWYAQAYTRVDFWKGTHTPFWSYLTHWGLFLFVILSWMAWETREWLANTPLSALRKLAPYRGLIYAGLFVGLVWVVLLFAMGVTIAWLVLPLAAWAGVLIFRPGMPDSKRIVLFLIGTGLVLTLMVEVIVLRGDIGRMNTVFKFYLQTWTLFAISAAAALGWLVMTLPKWIPSWRAAWQIALVGLVASASLYPIMASAAKIEDRMQPDAPHTLNGMTFMEYATYDDFNTTMDLSQDYRAIRWMQENVQGSPVIVEGNMVEYHWADRVTIYTGLPNVIGWNWHQRQQRAAGPEYLVPQRIGQINEFYLTEDSSFAQEFLHDYEVRYIIVGQLERALYPGPGLNKFENLNGNLWHEVYRDGETVIYEVLGNPGSTEFN